MAGHAQLKFVMTECSKTQIQVLTKGSVESKEMRVFRVCCSQQERQSAFSMKNIMKQCLVFFYIGIYNRIMRSEIKQ